MREDRKGSLQKAYAAGMIPKSEYVVGQTYIGYCRNQSEATWDGERFQYQRTKFGMTFPDHVECPEDEIGFDIFVPVEIKNERF